MRLAIVKFNLNGFSSVRFGLDVHTNVPVCTGTSCHQQNPRALVVLEGVKCQLPLAEFCVSIYTHVGNSESLQMQLDEIESPGPRGKDYAVKYHYPH